MAVEAAEGARPPADRRIPPFLPVVASILLISGGLVGGAARNYAPDQWPAGLPLRVVAGALIVAAAWQWPRIGARLGVLMLVTGAVVFAADLRAFPDPVLFAAGFLISGLAAATAAHLALALPDGRLRGRLSPATAVLAYAGAINFPVVRFFLERPQPPALAPLAGEGSRIALIGAGHVVLVALGVIVVLTRRRLTWPSVAAVLAASAWMAVAVASVLPLPARVEVAAGAALFALWLGVVGLLLVRGRARARATAARIAEITRGLAPGVGHDHLEQALAVTLGDPSLRLTGSGDQWVIEHDPALRDPGPAVAVLDRVHHLAGLSVRAGEAGRSRRRLATAVIDEQRSLQGAVQQAPQHHLVAAAMFADLAAERLEHPGDADDGTATEALAEARQHVEDALAELREQLSAFYPRALGVHGLAAALSERFPGRVSVSCPARRWPPPVEFTAFVVTAQVLTAARGRSAATVHLSEHTGRLILEVTVEGGDGEVPMAELTDRVAAIGGSVTADPGDGLRIRAELPLPEDHRPGLGEAA